MPSYTTHIQILNPLKECVCIVGMRQEGKTTLLKWLMHYLENNYTAFDTLGAIGNFKPRYPERQKIIKPRYSLSQPIFIKTCKQVWKEGNQVFIVDEVGKFCTKHTMPPELGDLVDLGGNRNISLWFTTRRVAEVHNNLIANAQHHFIFRTFLPQDVDWYGQFIPKNVILMSKTLPKHWFIYYQVGHEPIICKPVKVYGN